MVSRVDIQGGNTDLVKSWSGVPKTVTGHFGQKLDQGAKLENGQLRLKFVNPWRVAVDSITMPIGASSCRRHGIMPWDGNTKTKGGCLDDINISRHLPLGGFSQSDQPRDRSPAHSKSPQLWGSAK